MLNFKPQWHLYSALLQQSVTLAFAHRVYLWFSYDSQRKHWLLTKRALTNWSRPVLRPTQSSIQWVSLVLSPGVKSSRGQGKVWVGAISYPPWCLHGVAGQLYFILTIFGFKGLIVAWLVKCCKQPLQLNKFKINRSIYGRQKPLTLRQFPFF
jgi:hypothetical protein